MKIQSPGFCAALLVALIVTTLAPGCDGKSPTAPSLVEGELTLPAPLYASNASGLTDSERRVVRTEAALEELWDEIFADGMDAEATPEVDFNVNMVLAVASGEQPDACYSIAITSATSDGTDLTVTVTETGPTSDCTCADLVVHPVEVLEVPRADEVFFQTVTATDCAA